MAWNNGFPVTYPQMYPAYAPQAQPFSQPIIQPQQGGNPAPSFTPPTIRAEIIQVDDEKAAGAFPVGPGASQMMIAKDDSAIFIKTAMANGQTTLEVFEKRPPAPPAPVFDPKEYVRKDELETLVSAALVAQTAKPTTVSAKRVVRKEEDA